nr:MAG TPA: hypothetical protein [Bacteriophage sp.]
MTRHEIRVIIKSQQRETSNKAKGVKHYDKPHKHF